MTWISIVRAFLMTLFELIPFAILVFFIWAVIAVEKQLNRIEVLLREIRDRLPELENSPGGTGGR